MVNKKEGKTLVQHNVSDAVYAVRAEDGTPGTVKPMTYMNTFSKERAPQTTAIYGDGVMQDEIVVENTISGNAGTTARDIDFEKDMGFSKELASGIAEMAMTSLVRCDYGFKTSVKEAGKPEKVKKVWVLNAAFRPANESLTQDQDSITQSTFEYPYTAYGDYLKDSAGTSDYVDENGAKHKVFTLSCMPGEEGYNTFLENVPIPKIKAQEMSQASAQTTTLKA